MTKQNYALHIFALSCIFTLGNSINLIATTSFAALFILCVLSLISAVVVNFLLKMGQKNKVVYLITTLLLCVVALYGAVTTFLDYANYLMMEQMPRESKFLLTLVLLAVVVFFSSAKKQAIYKYCLFSFVIIAVIVTVCFAAGIANYNYKNISTNLLIFSFLPRQYIKLFLPVVVLPLFNYENKNQIKNTNYGIVMGFGIVFLATLQTILTLGNNYETAYPYLKAVGIISSGSLFTRIDGAIWFVFFVCAVIKIIVCVKAVFIITKNIKK